MSKLEDRFAEDRALRDSAKAVLLADLEHTRSSFSAKGVANRVGTRIGDGAVDVFETAKQGAGRNGGIIAALIGLIILWFGRETLIEAVERVLDRSDSDDPEAASKQSSGTNPLEDAEPTSQTPPLARPRWRSR